MGPPVGGRRAMGWEARHDIGPRRLGLMPRDGYMSEIRGRVAGIEHGPRGGVILMIESESRITPVHIGPNQRIEEQIEKNERVEISGRRVVRGGRPVLIALDLRLEGEDESVALRPLDERPRRGRWRARVD